MAIQRVYSRGALNAMNHFDLIALARGMDPTYVARIGTKKADVMTHVMNYQDVHITGWRKAVGVSIDYVATHPRRVLSTGSVAALGAVGLGLYATDTWPFNETAQTADADKDANGGLNGKREEAPAEKPAEGARPLEPAAEVAEPPAPAEKPA